MDHRLRPSIQVSPPDRRPPNSMDASSFSQDTTPFSPSASFAMSPSTHTSHGIHAEFMSRQPSSQGWNASGNDSDAASLLGAQFPQPTPVGLNPTGEFLRQSQFPGSAKFHGLCSDLYALSSRTQDISDLSREEVHIVHDLTRGTLGRILGTIQSIMDSQAQPLQPLQPSYIGHKNGPTSYHCRLCNKNCKTRGSFIRHVTYMHAHRYHYDCLLRADGCSWEGFRRDKVHDHTQNKHNELGKVTGQQIDSVETELQFPGRCMICYEPVSSWEHFLDCMASHCEVHTGNNAGEDDDGNGNGGSGNGFNGQPLLDFGSGTMGSYDLQNGLGSTQGGNSFHNPSGQFVYHQGNAQQGGSLTDTLHLGDRSGEPSSRDVFLGPGYCSVNLAAERMPQAAASSGFGQSFQVENSPAVSAANKMTSPLRTRPSGSQSFQDTASVPDNNRANGSRPKRSTKHGTRTSGRPKPISKRPSKPSGSGKASQRLQSQLNPASPRVQYPALMSNASRSALSSNLPLNQPTNASNPEPTSPSGNMDFGNQESALRSPVEPTEDFQDPALGKYSSALSTDNPFALPMGMRSMSTGTYNMASGPVHESFGQSSLETTANSSFMPDQPSDSSAALFNEMIPFGQLGVPSQNTPNNPASSSMLRSASSTTYPIGRPSTQSKKYRS